MRIRFVVQPFADGHDLRDFLAAVAADESVGSLDIVVAWAKRSGLSRLRKDLERVRARAGETRLIVGIDEGGATQQGFELARELFDSVHVFHDRAGRTFHPKVYVAWGKAAARLLVGSHNATAGGVYFNYEAGIECDLVLPDDESLLNSVHDYVARLFADTTACKELTEELLEELLANPRYRVGNEDAGHKLAVVESPEELDADVDIEAVPGPAEWAPSVFGGSAEPKRPHLVAPTDATKSAPTEKSDPDAVSIPGTPGPGPGTADMVRKRWFKRLSASDAQHPPTAGSKVTGALRLNQADHPIDWRTYFRNDFFGGEAWQREESQHGFDLDHVAIPFEVVVNGQVIGDYTVRVDHAPHRESGQANVPTDLKWGPLMSALRVIDYTGSFVILERLANSSYRLEITPNDPGPEAFIA